MCCELRWKDGQPSAEQVLVSAGACQKAGTFELLGGRAVRLQSSIELRERIRGDRAQL